MQRHRHTSSLRSLVLAGVMSAALVTPAAARLDLSPAVRDQAAAAPAQIDLRSPDAQDAGRPVAFDLRSPDAAQPVRLPTAKPAVAPQPAPSTGDGFDIVSALIGAGAALLFALSGVALTRTRDRRRTVGAPQGVAPLGS